MVCWIFFVHAGEENALCYAVRERAALVSFEDLQQEEEEGDEEEGASAG